MLWVRRGKPKSGGRPTPPAALKMVSPGRASTQPGLSLHPNDMDPSSGTLPFGKRTRKPNSVLCGHSSRRRVAADTHQRPTRRFRPLLEPPCRIGPMRSRRVALDAGFPPYLVLLRVGFTLPQPLLAARCALTAPFHPYRTGRPGIRPSGQPARAEARTVRRYVFCGTRPSVSLDAHVPDVIRHTALRSSDFPLPSTPAHAEVSGSDRPVLLPEDSLPRIRISMNLP